MVKSAIIDYSSTAGSNTDVGGVDIDEACAMAGINNAIREVMSHTKDALTAGTFLVPTIVTTGVSDTLTAAEHRGNIVIGTAAITLTLTAPGTLGNGFHCWIRANGGVISLAPAGAENIDGAAATLSIPDDTSCFVVCDGTNFYTTINSGLQTQGAVLDDLNTLGANAADSEFLVGTGAGALAWESGATALTSMGAQTLHAYLTDIAAITAAQGDVIYFDGTDWVNLGPGTARQVLETAGAAADPTWANAGKWGTAIDTGNIQSGTTVAATGLGGYSEIKVRWTAVSHDSGSNRQLEMVVGTGGTPTYVTSGYLASANEGGGDTESTTEIPLIRTNQAAADTISGWLIFSDWNVAGQCDFHGRCSDTDGSDSCVIAGSENGSTARTAIKFQLSGAGNFDGSGTYEVFGR